MSGKLNLSVSILILLTTFTINVAAQQQARLIIRGDDMGYSHAGNEAIIQSSKNGIQSSVEVIVPSPWFPEAVRLLNENPGIDVGVHLAITSEWDNVKWRPLTDCRSLVDEDGYFLPMIFPNKNYPGKAVTENRWTMHDLEKEFRAQIEMAIKKIPGVTHISAHMGCTALNDSSRIMIKRLVKEYGLDIDLEQHNVKYVSYKGAHKTGAEKVKSFIAMLDDLKPGQTYLFVDHPGLDSPELRAISHIDYEDVAADRQGVTDLFTSQVVKDAITKRKISIISYADLK